MPRNLAHLHGEIPFPRKYPLDNLITVKIYPGQLPLTSCVKLRRKREARHFKRILYRKSGKFPKCRIFPDWKVHPLEKSLPIEKSPAKNSHPPPPENVYILHNNKYIYFYMTKYVYVCIYIFLLFHWSIFYLQIYIINLVCSIY